MKECEKFVNPSQPQLYAVAKWRVLSEVVLLNNLHADHVQSLDGKHQTLTRVLAQSSRG